MESNLTVHHLNADLGYRSTKDLLVNQVMTHAGHYTILGIIIVASISRYPFSVHEALLFDPLIFCP